MADKKLNAVSTASDGAYIYAEDASGNQIKISKADLATVVAGLLGINSTWFRNNGKTSVNANDLSAGISSGYLGSSASSFNYPYEYSIVLTFVANDGLKIQIATNSDRSSPHISYRINWEGWSSWRQIV